MITDGGRARSTEPARISATCDELRIKYPSLAMGLSLIEAAAEDERVERAYEAFCGRSPGQTAARLLREFLGPIPGFADATLDNFSAESPDGSEALAAARRYAATWPDRRAAKQGIVLYGPVGGGKDHLAIGTAREIIRRHQDRAVYVSGTALFARLRDAMDDHKSEASIIGPLVAAPVLVLSDPLPPAGRLTDWQMAALFGLVDGRYRAGKRAIVTVNVADASEANYRMGAPTWSRLRDGAWAVPCNWADHRSPAIQVGADRRAAVNFQRAGACWRPAQRLACTGAAARGAS